MPDQNIVERFVWPLLASMAGSVTALSFSPYKTMARADICLSLAVGALFAYFVGPLIVGQITASNDIHMQGAVYYTLASGSNVFIPMAIKKVKSLFGVADEGNQQ